MSGTSRSPLFGVVLVGAVYALVGLVSSALARSSPPQTHAWRLAAWFASGLVYLSHIAFERRQGSARSTALRVAWAVALGGLGLAVSASIHSRHPLVLALVIWPILVGVPAFLIALVVAGVLVRASRS